MSKYAEFERRAAEADRRIAELAARVEAMEKASGSKGGDSAVEAELRAIIKKQEATIKKLEAQNAGLKKQAQANKAPKEKKEKKKGGSNKKKGGSNKKKNKKDAKKEAEAAEKEKKLFKAAKKEGGKKGQDISGLNEMGGVLFFHVTIDNSFGRWDLLDETMNGFNTEVDPAAEDRKGGAGHLSKAIFSAGEKELLIYVHVPAANKELASGKEWVEALLPGMGAAAKIIEEKGDFIKVVCPGDPDNALYPLKMRDLAINQGFDFLRKRKLVVDADSDDDVNYGDMAAEAGVSWGADDEDY